MAFTRAEALAAVEQSPAAFSVHDRDGWIGAFSRDGRIEDPVGSKPHRGRTAITRFYDTFIGPRDITMHRDVDIIVGSTVIRDLELEVVAAGLTMRFPAYLRYNLEVDGGEFKIAELYAFWELPALAGQLLRSGLRSVPPSVELSKGLLTNQGISGTLGFLSGFRGTGPQGKRRFRRFLDDARAGDEVAVRRWLGKGARVTSGDDLPLSTAELLSRIATAHPHKMIAAGYSVIVGMDREGGRDVLIAEVAAKPFAIRRIRYFTEDTAGG
jgi:hypothetical protein